MNPLRTVYSVNLSSGSFVNIKLDLSDSKCQFIIDSGSDISLIKANRIKPMQQYNPKDKCSISGIGSGIIETYGSTTSNIILDNLIVHQSFYIVGNNFPIPADGILGRDFLAKHRCCIDYNSWLLSIYVNNEIITIPICDKNNRHNIIPPRCEILKSVNLPQLNEDSVIISGEIQPGVFYANAIINQNNSFIRFLNTTDKPAIIPTNFSPQLYPLHTYHIDTTVHLQNPNEIRTNQILNEIELGHLEPSLKSHIQKLCTEYNDIFTLENDKLTANNFYEQEIKLKEPVSVYIKKL